MGKFSIISREAGSAIQDHVEALEARASKAEDRSATLSAELAEAVGLLEGLMADYHEDPGHIRDVYPGQAARIRSFLAKVSR